MIYGQTKEIDGRIAPHGVARVIYGYGYSYEDGYGYIEEG